MSVALVPGSSVTLQGEAVRGSTLQVSADLNDLGPQASPTYQWFADGQALSGQTGKALQLNASWVGQSIHCAVSYLNLSGQAVSLSTEASAPVAPNAPPEQVLAWSPYITAIEKTSFAWTVPSGSVQDPENKALSWSATLTNGNALPAWLKFDSSTLTLKGAPDLSAAGNYNLTLKATDPYGLQWSSAPLQLSVLSLPASTGSSVFEFRHAVLKDKWLSFDVFYTGSSKLQTTSLELSLQLPATIEKVTASKNAGWAFMTGVDNSDLLLLAPSAKSLSAGQLVSHFDLKLDAYVASLPLSLTDGGLLVNNLAAAIPTAVVLSQPEAPKIQKGVVQDGYLVNALVWIDENGDGQWTREALVDKNNNQQVEDGEYLDVNGNGFFDAEPWTLTDASGNFDGLIGTGSLKIQGWTFNADGSLPTVDLSTGTVFNGSLSAPEGAKVINPITTLVQSAVASGKTAEQAQTLVKSVLGVTGSLDLLSFDPVASSQNTTQASDALKVQKAALQVANLMQVAVDTASAAGANNSLNVVDSVASSLVAAASATAAGSTLNLGSSELISSALNAAADTAFATQANSTAKEVLKAQSQSIGTALSEVNTSIDTIVNKALSEGATSGKVDTAAALVTIVAAQIVAQEQVSAQAQSVVAQAVISGDTSSTSIDVNLSQGMGLALSKVGQVFVSQAGAAPLAVNDQVRLSLPGSTSGARSGLTVQGSVLNNDTADSSYNKTVGAAAAGETGSLGSVSTTLTLIGQYGSLLLRNDGSYTYTEDPSKSAAIGANQIANDVFTYQVSDGAGMDDRKSLASLTVALDRINLAPSVSLNQTSFKLAGSGFDGDTAKILNLLANASDPEQDTLTVSGIKVGSVALGTLSSLKTSYGQITVREGALYFEPDASNPALKALNEGQSLKEMLSYTVSDGINTPTPAVLQLVMQGSNDSPQIGNALVNQSVAESRSLTYTLASNSFSDVDDSSLSYTATLESGEALPSWLTFNAASRSFTAQPGVDVVGDTAQAWTVNVNAKDSGGASVSSSLTWTVAPKPPGVDIAVTARYWNASLSGTAPKLSGAAFSTGGVSGQTNSQGSVLLQGVADTDGTDDGIITLAPSLAAPSNAKAAITLTDVLAALKIYLGKALPSTYASPLNFIAADFDGVGGVTLTDVLSLLKYYLGKSTTAAPQWVFVDAADITGSGSTAVVTGANGQPLSKTNTTPHAIDQLFDADHSAIELIGVLRGDVDGSWNG